MKKLILVLLLCLSTFSCGQTLTTVTATITDLSGQAFIAGTVQADYQRPAGKQGVVPLSNGVPIVEHGAPLFTTLNSSGHFSIALADLSTVSPTGGYWNFTICPNASSTCPVATTASVVGASVDLSAILSAQMGTISVAAQPTLARAYKDTEIIRASGITWLDVTLNQLKYIDALNVIHLIGSGNGTVTSITAGAGLSGGTITTSGTIAESLPITSVLSPLSVTSGVLSCPNCINGTSTPSVLAGTAAGSGASASFIAGSTDRAGKVALSTGTGVSTTGVLFTVTYGTAFSVAVSCIVEGMFASNANTSFLNVSNVGSFEVDASSVALSDTHTYEFSYLCDGN